MVEVRVVDRAGNRATVESHFQLEAGRVQTISPSTTALLAILVMVLLIGAVYGVRFVRHRTTGPKVQPSAGQHEEWTESPPDDGESEIVHQGEERDQGEAVEGLEPMDTRWEEY